MSAPTILTCPRCGLLSPGSAETCDCGYSFIPNSATVSDRITLPGAGLHYAGFWVRTAALIADWFCLMLTLFVGLLIAGLLNGVGLNAVGGIIAAVVILAPVLYFPAFESSAWQATPGKRLLKLKVVDLAGRRIGLSTAVLRYLAKFGSSLLFGMGYIMVAFTEKKQGLHDKAAGTVVIEV